jgi:hypothetical protein
MPKGKDNGKAGIRLTFTRDGKLTLLKGMSGDDVVAQGTYDLAYYNLNTGAMLISCLVLKIEPEGQEASVIPASFFSGEGDPCGLVLWMMDNPFGRLLKERIGVSVSSPLHFSHPSW